MDYEKTTEGIRVVVRPSFSLPYSEPADGKFVFTYLVEMENQSAEAAQLLFRHWHIHDSDGEDSELEGEGVLGEQPSLAPGKSHVYESFCVLQSPVGFMEGYYTFVRPNGEKFRVNIPRFDLRAPWTVGGGPKAEQMN
jgi:ApaG protein